MPKRDVDAEILRFLQDKPLEQHYISKMVAELGWSTTTIKNHLNVMKGEGWVLAYPPTFVVAVRKGQPKRLIWSLTPKGSRVAQFRVRSNNP